MKKITLLFILLIAFNWESNAQLTEGFEGGVVPPAGWASFENGFGAAEVWEVSAIANTGTNAAFINYDASDGGNDKEDWLVTSLIDLSSATAAELRFFTRQAFGTIYNSVYEIRVSTNTQTTPGDFTPIQSWDETTLNAAATTYEEKVVDLSAYDGMTIYVAFVHTNDDGDGWYVDDVSVADASCVPPIGLSATAASTTADISWTAVVLEVGGYDWAVMDDGDDPDVDSPADSGSTATGVTSDSASGLSVSTDYDLYVRTICSGGPTAWSAKLDFSTGPVNDSACNAIDITGMVGTPSTGGAYNNFGAKTETSELSGTCWSFGATADQSVWFKFTTAGGDVTLSTNYNDGTATDTVLALYTVSDCSDLSTLTEVACNDDLSGAIFLAEIVTTLAAGTYYLQVDTWGNGSEDTFDIGYFDTSSLSNSTFEEETSLSYFPNPVNDKLTLKAQQNIQNVSVFNMLGQEVIRTEMNLQRGELDMSSLQSGPYFVKVSINDTIETIKIIKK